MKRKASQETILVYPVGLKFLGDKVPLGFREWCLATAVELAEEAVLASEELAIWAVTPRDEWGPPLPRRTRGGRGAEHSLVAEVERTASGREDEGRHRARAAAREAAIHPGPRTSASLHRLHSGPFAHYRGGPGTAWRPP